MSTAIDFFATGEKAKTAYVKETTWGTTPATPSLISIPFITNGANLTRNVFEDPSIQPDSQVHYLRMGNRAVAGDAAFAFAHGTYDDFLEALFQGTWTENVLKNGDTFQSFTIELANPDISVYRRFTGMVPNSFQLEVNLDGVIQSTFGFIGKDMEDDDTSADADGYTAPASGKQPFVHFDGSYEYDGVTASTLTSIQLNIDNGFVANYALGDDSAKNITRGKFVVTGTLGMHFKDGAALEDFLEEDEVALEFVLNDGNDNTQTWLLPKIKLTGFDVNTATGTIQVTAPFQALYDSSAGCTAQITRSAD